MSSQCNRGGAVYTDCNRFVFTNDARFIQLDLLRYPAQIPCFLQEAGVQKMMPDKRLPSTCLDSVMCIGEDMTSILPGIALTASAVLGGSSLVEMEKTYWDCEFAAEQGMLDSSDAGACSEVYERLKMEKFNNDFRRFLQWWKTNKGREYAARADLRRYRVPAD
jgi:hypothetical protein